MILLLLSKPHPLLSFFFFFNDTATTEIYTLSLHDALPISSITNPWRGRIWTPGCGKFSSCAPTAPRLSRSEEHTSELQSQSNLVCRLLLEKKKKTNTYTDQHSTTNPLTSISIDRSSQSLLA